MLDRLREWMRSESVGAVCLTDPISIAYLTEVQLNPHDRLCALIVTVAEATLVLPALETPGARSAVKGAALRPWTDGQDPWRVVAEALAGTGDRLGVEKAHLSLARWEKLRSLTGASQALDAGWPLTRLRSRKSPQELAALQHAAKLTDAVTERIWEHIHEGITETEIGRALEALMAELGAAPSFEGIALSGPNTALPHGRQSERRLQPGDLVLLDFGARHDGYAADTTRVGVVEPPSREQVELHALVLAAHDSAIAAVRAGGRGAGRDRPRHNPRCRPWRALQSPPRPRPGSGSPRTPEPRPRQRHRAGGGHDDHDRTRRLRPGLGRHSHRGRLVLEAGGARLLTRADRSLRCIG